MQEKNPIKSNRYSVVLQESFKNYVLLKKNNLQVFEKGPFSPNFNGLYRFNENLNQ